MHEYDVTLKSVLRGSAQVAMQELAGVVIDKWVDVELPKFQNPRVDLLGETRGSLVHIELQSTLLARLNDRRAAMHEIIGKLSGLGTGAREG